MRFRAKTWVRSIVGLGLLIQPMVASAIPSPITQTTDPFMRTGQLSFAIQTFSPTEKTIDSPQTDSQSLSTLNLFDPAFGHLDSVTISLSSTFIGTTTVSARQIGDGTEDTSYFADGSLTMTLKGLGINPDLSSSSSVITAKCENLQGGDSCPPPQPPSTQTLSGIFSPLSISLTTDSSVAPFIWDGTGTGTFNWTASLLSTLSPRTNPSDNGTGNFPDNSTFSGTFNSSWNGKVTLVYNFTPSTAAVPAPLTLYLIIGELGGIALLRRRRG